MSETLEQTFVAQFQGQKFVTGVMCRLDCDSGSFRWVNAGHLPPLLIGKQGVVELSTPARCPLGLDLDHHADVHEVQLEPGDSIVLYSDGLVEARSPDGEDFTFERVRDLIEQAMAEHGRLPAIVHEVIEELKDHSAGPLRDDATLVLLNYLG